ncbi:uncharacterized protein LOC109855705 isoform X2 [Pseudomyrmex gracilis]|uniref:uncharacterized protein LOC109855705 isoform X2 n=1 Tax=Pseudomyrmex gracilis TaxID=219809 RepID=UPI00099527DB|nr:uncharacterized protein LOC109855705 isoform X2 [Pseudomyrmex gracilis]
MVFWKGKCSLKEQLPFLRLLLDFMRKVHVDPYVNTSKTQEKTLTDIIKLYINDTDHAVDKPKVSYTDAIKYFKKYEKETVSKTIKDVQSSLCEDAHVENDNELVHTEQNMQFDKEQEKLIEAFETVSSWPVQKRNIDENISDSICSNITSISSDFNTLRQVLQAKDEISKVNLGTEFQKTTTPLHAIIEDIVIYNEKLDNLLTANNSD